LCIAIPQQPVHKNGAVLFPRTGREQRFGLGVEAHDNLVAALVYLIFGPVQQGLELPQICWLEA
jgi:hypothetical protein